MGQLVSSAFVESVGRALDVLELLKDAAPHSLRVTDLALQFGVDPATISRLMGTLVDRGFATRLPDKTFTVGPKSFRLATPWLEWLHRNFAPHVEAIADTAGETVHLLQLLGGEAVTIAHTTPSSRCMILNEHNLSYPLWCTAGGQALLAQIPSVRRVELLPRPHFPKPTPASVGTWDELAKSLERGMRLGIFSEEGGLFEPLACYGVPVQTPKRGVVFAIAVSFPVEKVERERAKIRNIMLQESQRLLKKFN